MASYVYWQGKEDGQTYFFVGFHDPGGDTWERESKHNTKDEAAARVIELNGGRPANFGTVELEIGEGKVNLHQFADAFSKWDNKKQAQFLEYVGAHFGCLLAHEYDNQVAFIADVLGQDGRLFIQKLHGFIEALN